MKARLVLALATSVTVACTFLVPIEAEDFTGGTVPLDAEAAVDERAESDVFADHQTEDDAATDAADAGDGGLPPGLVGYWRFEDGLTEELGGASAAVSGPPVYGVGARGKSIECHVGFQISLGDRFDLGMGSRTFVAWIKLGDREDGGSTNRTIFHKGADWSNSLELGPGYSLGYREPPAFQATVADGTTSIIGSGPYASAQNGAFHMVAMAVSSTGYEIHVDNFLVATKPVDLTTSIENASQFVLCNSGSSFSLQGSIDEVMFFDRALSRTELDSIIAYVTR